MDDSAIVILVLIFWGIRHLMKRVTQTAKTSSKTTKNPIKQKKPTTGQPIPSAQDLPEAVPVTCYLDDWRKQFAEEPFNNTQLHVQHPISSPLSRKENETIKPLVSTVQDTSTKPGFSWVSVEYKHNMKTVEVLPNFNRNSLLQAVVLKEILSRPASTKCISARMVH
jgi:hypothetical protein